MKTGVGKGGAAASYFPRLDFQITKVSSDYTFTIIYIINFSILKRGGKNQKENGKIIGRTRKAEATEGPVVSEEEGRCWKLGPEGRTWLLGRALGHTVAVPAVVCTSLLSLVTLCFLLHPSAHMCFFFGRLQSRPVAEP